VIMLQVIGVPIQGGSGMREWRPTTIAEVQRQYHSAFGESTIDLLNVPFTSGALSVTATLGVGVLIVDVPSNVTVSLRSHVGIGNVVSNQFRPLPLFTTPTSHKTNLELNLQVGVGQIEVRRVSR
jgi:predicted membrane protein